MSTILNDVRSEPAPMIVRDIEIESKQWNSFNFEPQKKQQQWALEQRTLVEFIYKVFYFTLFSRASQQQ